MDQSLALSRIRDRQWLVLMMFAVWLLPRLDVQAVDSEPRPNLVVVMADDMGYADASSYGNDRYQTPNIDRLAREGLRLLDYHSSGVVCSPTRAGLVTGRYQQRAGVPAVISAANHRYEGLHAKEVTFAECLKDAGYQTAVMGKWHLGYQVKFNPLKNGFDQFHGYVSGNVDYFSHIDQTGIYDWWAGEELVKEEGYSTYLITRHAVEFIREHQKQRFCLYVAHEAPHYPYQGPHDKPVRTVGGKFDNRGNREDKAAAYAEMMQAMDAGVGEILKTLKTCGLERNTFVFFCSDNGGTALGNNGKLRGHKGQMWEGGHRVPGVAWWPGKIEPGTSEETIISLDVMPTLLALANAKVPAGHHLDGVNFLPHFLEGKALPERTLFWEMAGRSAVRRGDWKLVVNQGPKRGKTNSVALYNLAEDLGEQHDLSKTNSQTAEELMQALKNWRKDVKTGATIQPKGPQAEKRRQ